MDFVNKNGFIFTFKIVLFILLAYFPVFLHLEFLPIRVWDESRLANNAYEMFKNGNFLVPHFEGTPDMWNTKPPLMVILQVLCCKVFGIRELSIRLPSAIAGFLTAVNIPFRGGQGNEVLFLSHADHKKHGIILFMTTFN